MPETSNPKRVRDIRAAIARAKQRDKLSLEDLATIWGTAKSRFVTVRNTMPGFPEPVDKVGNQHVFPAIRALKAMLKHEQRHDEMARIQQNRADAILGKRRKPDEPVIAPMSANEMATLSRLAAETEERERAQGLYIPATEVAAVAHDVFSEISDFGSRLSNEIDPHGRLAPDVRLSIDKAAKEAVLRCHANMRQILSPDARQDGNRTATRRPGRAPARR